MLASGVRSKKRRIQTRRVLAAELLAFAIISSATSGHADAPCEGRTCSRPPCLLVVLIGGMDSDPTPAQIAGTAARNEGNSGLYRMFHDLRRDRVLPEYFNWNGTRAGEMKSPMPPRSRGIAEFIRAHLARHPQDRVAVVGNSWGGQTALEAIQQLRQGETPLAVHLAVFLDAASAGRGQPPPRQLPENIGRAVQYRTRNVFVWGKLPDDSRLESIDLGDPAAGYMREGKPPYNAPFDFQSHVAAEWDERIHQDIERRLLELLPGD
jgi:pimeloyl-ACP methyl ester carboxylesterase